MKKDIEFKNDYIEFSVKGIAEKFYWFFEHRNGWGDYISSKKGNKTTIGKCINEIEKQIKKIKE